MHSRSLLSFVFACLAGTTGACLAAEPSANAAPANTKASFAPAAPNDTHPGARAGDAQTLVFAAAPRESTQEGQQIYTPIAAYLSKALGKRVVYRHPGTWGAYRSEMLKGNYDIVFDGPHFNSYRAEKLQHHVLVKLPGRHEFAVIVRKGEKFTSLAQMGGRTFCTHAPPNLGALILLSQFDNPSRQPSIIPTDGWEKIYAGVMSGRCAGGILPLANLKKLDAHEDTRVLFKTTALPNQAFSAGPRLTAEEKARVAAALTAPEAAVATEKLRAAFKAEQLVATNDAEYQGIAQYLRSEWGYYE
jgi:ABC-type phosphate/phosphonate transport system substrate-binding protein